MFFISDAYAQAAGAAAETPGIGEVLLQQAMLIVPIGLLFYFLLIRPQQRRAKEQQAMLNAIAKGDTIVTTGGIIGKVKSVADDELRVEIAPNVDIRLERYAIATVRNRTAPAPANDAKP